MSVMQGGQVIGLLIIIVGLLSIFARDFFWKTERFSDLLRGKRTERTALWDMWQVLKGVLAIVIGLSLMSQGHF
ncbi:hypothetical protein TFLX_00007 [Thermoflexales bacterium]|nr:hypothetical protein TFLX_00007 [Thermoflexales bacterium]